jgi:hypothetical protein
VAVVEDLEVASVKKSMLERLALIIARRNSRAVRRRVARAHVGEHSGRGVKRIISELALEVSGEFR